MPFFDVVPEEQMTPEARALIERAKQRARSDRLVPSYYAMAAYPPLLQGFVEAFQTLVPVPNRFGMVQFIASMLIAHAQRCGPCFAASRTFHLNTGLDEAALEQMCQAPDRLPLSERDCEVELRDGDVGGIAVHVAARVMQAAGAGEVLVSRVVSDLVAGSGIAFAEHGEIALKGLNGTWRLLAAKPSAAA